MPKQIASSRSKRQAKLAARATKPPTGRTAVPEVAAIVAPFKRSGGVRIRQDKAKRYGITGPTAETSFGVPVRVIRDIAKRLVRELGGKKGGPARHDLALKLWAYEGGQYEARMLAAFIDDPGEVTAAQMDAWAKDFDNWGICDTVCFHLFDKVPTKLAFAQIAKWAKSKDEFVKRAAFALLASLALHLRPRDAEGAAFLKCLPLAKRATADERNFVKKGVSWALRGMGKRTPEMKQTVLEMARRLSESENAVERWVGKDVLCDLKK